MDVVPHFISRVEAAGGETSTITGNVVSVTWPPMSVARTWILKLAPSGSAPASSCQAASQLSLVGAFMDVFADANSAGAHGSEPVRHSTLARPAVSLAVPLRSSVRGSRYCLSVSVEGDSVTDGGCVSTMNVSVVELVLPSWFLAVPTAVCVPSAVGVQSTDQILSVIASGCQLQSMSVTPSTVSWKLSSDDTSACASPLTFRLPVRAITPAGLENITITPLESASAAETLCAESAFPYVAGPRPVAARVRGQSGTPGERIVRKSAGFGGSSLAAMPAAPAAAPPACASAVVQLPAVSQACDVDETIAGLSRRKPASFADRKESACAAPTAEPVATAMPSASPGVAVTETNAGWAGSVTSITCRPQLPSAT